mgnify:CR=1 FL=1
MANKDTKKTDKHKVAFAVVRYKRVHILQFPTPLIRELLAVFAFFCYLPANRLCSF